MGKIKQSTKKELAAAEKLHQESQKEIKEAAKSTGTVSTSKSSSKKRKVKNPAAKGKAFERQIAQALGHIFPDAERMLEYQSSNNIGTDLQNTDMWRFQCKAHATYTNPSKIHEIRDPNPHVPVLVTKGNNRPPMAILPFTEFVTLLEMAYGHRERLINPYVKDVVESKLALLGTSIKLLPHDDQFGRKLTMMPGEITDAEVEAWHQGPIVSFPKQETVDAHFTEVAAIITAPTLSDLI